jgi:glycosyltransferase involved in cell wall biosynthesis
MKNFLFIIPLTPKAYLDPTRSYLQKKCLENLRNQTYSNWHAILIGDLARELSKKSKCFSTIDFEGKKEEKLQKATEYIIENNIESDYIIRLDDDDFFNPRLLKKIQLLDFDLYVDKQQFFWHLESGLVSSRTWYWFPNTCIHKTACALTRWGDFAEGHFTKFHQDALLIENNHSLLHSFYKSKHIIHADKNDPVYLRTITASSITASSANNYCNYLNSFGNWKNKKLASYNLPSEFVTQRIHQPLRIKLRNIKNELIAKKNYLKCINYAH